MRKHFSRDYDLHSSGTTDTLPLSHTHHFAFVVVVVDAVVMRLHITNIYLFHLTIEHLFFFCFRALLHQHKTIADRRW